MSNSKPKFLPPGYGSDPTALVPYGVPRRTYSLRVAWAYRLESGSIWCSEGAKRKIGEWARKMVQANLAKRTNFCKRGHEWTPANTILRKGGPARECRICRALLRGHRPEWVTVNKIKVSLYAHDRYYWDKYDALYAAMLAAHPDRRAQEQGRYKGSRGQGHVKFIRARKSLLAFESAEAKWYKSVGMTVPTSRSECAYDCVAKGNVTVSARAKAWNTRRAKYGPTGYAIDASDKSKRSWATRLRNIANGHRRYAQARR